MPHVPFHGFFDYDEELAAQGRALYEESTRGYAGTFASQNNLFSFSDEQQAALDEYQKSLRNKPGRAISFIMDRATGFNRGGGGLVGEFSDYLKDQGFSTQESLEFFKELDADPEEFFGGKMPKEQGEKVRFLKAYFDEAQNLYTQAATTEQEMMREDKAAREQTEFDKAQREAFNLSDQEEGEVASRRRKAQQSQEYLQSRGGMTTRQARAAGSVMIPQSRPM
tara:strand:- start:1344 stop:2015 length:672 start_codon:yes stop_codon:yes gene_type:complete